MTYNSLLFAVVNAAAFMLSASFLIYIAFIVVPFLRHRPGLPGDEGGFGWHFFVPCLDEELVVEETVSRLRNRFPHGHIWCVDDASVDGTPDILARLCRADRHVHVVTRTHPRAQEGKGPALNAAWEALERWLPQGSDTDRVIVGVVDADGYLDPECLRIISGPGFFGDPEVGAVQIKVRVNNGHRNANGASASSRLWVRLQDMEFTSLIAGMQMLRHNVGSVGMGGNGQFTRLTTLDRVAVEFGQPWQHALIEDFEMGLHILLTGGRNEYCHDTWVLQQGPPTFRRLVRQRSRWGQGVMQCLRYLNPVLRSANISTPAAVEITYFILLPWLQVLGDVIYVIAFAAIGYAAFTVPGGPIHWFGEAGAWQLLPMFVVFGLGPICIWGPIYRRCVATELTRRQAIGLGLANWAYIFVHHAAVWWAFVRVLRNQRDWKKTERLDLRLLVPSIVSRARLARSGPPTVVPGRLYLSRDTTAVVPGPPLASRKGTTVPGRVVLVGRPANRLPSVDAEPPPKEAPTAASIPVAVG